MIHKLVILQVYDPLADAADKEFIFDTDFETSGQAELRALRWLMFRPDDIVMLVAVEEGICRNCRNIIHEKEGWVRHRWIHNGGHYACLPNGATQAEPV